MLKGLIRTARPHQWVKNLFVLAPLVFAQELFHTSMALRALLAFGLFSLASSTVYFINDIVDVEADRAHPIKRNRPIASGLVSTRAAGVCAALLGTTVLAVGWVLSWPFLAAVGSYFVLNLTYSVRLKRIAYIDVLCIAGGFELRVIAGAFAAMVPASNYLLVVTFLLASFLGFGKRMHELKQGQGAQKQRASLGAYHPQTLNVLLHITGAFTVATYIVYTLDPATREAFGTDYLATTAAFTIFGVLRFLHLVRHRPNSESPTEEMLRDKMFLSDLVLWAVAVVVTIYVG